MCPACLTSIALALVTTTSVGAGVVRILRRPPAKEQTEEARPDDPARPP
jgi:hypothetical protein